MTPWRLLRQIASPTEIQGELQVRDGDTWKHVCFTLELPYRNNLHDISAIPEGVYPMSRHFSQRHGHCIALADVTSRTGIEIHIGNTVADSIGCVLVGLKRATLSGKVAVMYSQVAMRQVLARFTDSGGSGDLLVLQPESRSVEVPGTVGSQRPCQAESFKAAK